MRDNGIVYLFLQSYLLNIGSYPFIGMFGAVGPYVRITGGSRAWIGGVQLTCIEKNGGAVGKNIKGGIATTRVDMMEIQVTLLPGRQGLTNGSNGLAPDDECR